MLSISQEIKDIERAMQNARIELYFVPIFGIRLRSDSLATLISQQGIDKISLAINQFSVY